MTYYITKIIVTVALVILISEISKKSSLVGAILASVPLVSVLAMAWLYIDTKDAQKVSALASSVFWLVIPSLSLFISLPLFLKNGFNFYLGMGASIIITIACYYGIIVILSHFGVKL